MDGNPRFRDLASDDFHLLPDSPAVDTGAAIPEVRSDHDGIPRPQGKAYDRGAYEYSPESLVPTTTAYTGIFTSGQNYPLVIGFTIKSKPASPAK